LTPSRVVDGEGVTDHGLTSQGVSPNLTPIRGLTPNGVTYGSEGDGNSNYNNGSDNNSNNSSSSSSSSMNCNNNKINNFDTTDTMKTDAAVTSVLSNRLKCIGIYPENTNELDSVPFQKHSKRKSKISNFLNSNKISSEIDDINIKNKIENFYYKVWLPFCQKIFQKCFVLTQSHKNILPQMSKKMHDHNLATRGEIYLFLFGYLVVFIRSSMFICTFIYTCIYAFMNTYSYKYA
jgi:hypothetical protein